MGNQVCNLRECSCSDGHCADVVAAHTKVCAEIASGLLNDFPNHRIRERLQVLESWKLDADETEMKWIEGYEAYLKYLLDPHRIPTSSHEPGWFEMRRLAGDYHEKGERS